jgi:BlaI family penicillinase repressor
MNTYQPTDAELEILQVIWDLQPVAVRDVHERILSSKDVGYTTVLKQIQRLAEKGVLEKTVDADGVHRYRSTLAAEDVKRGLAGRLLHTAFGGSAVELVMHALGRDKASAEELQALKAWLDQQLPK